MDKVQKYNSFNYTLVYCSPSQMFELRHIFEGFVGYFYIMILFYIQLMRHEKMLT
jgi:hypothetical protein